MDGPAGAVHPAERSGDPSQAAIPAVEVKENTLYFARFLQSKLPDETIPALVDIITEIESIYTCKQRVPHAR